MTGWQADHPPLDVEVLWPPDAAEPVWGVVVTFGHGSGMLEPVRLTITRYGRYPLAEGSPGLTATGLRQVPFGAIVREARKRLPAALGKELDALEKGGWFPAEEWSRILKGAAAVYRDELASRPRRGGRRPLAPEELLKAARDYAELLLTGVSPLLPELAARLGVSQSTAAKRVYKARQAGLLGPTRKGKAGGVPQTIILEAPTRTRTAESTTTRARAAKRKRGSE